LNRFRPILVLVALCWGVYVVNNLLLGGALTHYGIHPRRLGGLLGILWSPFLHNSFGHLAANTLPLLILGGIICARSQSEFVAVTIGGILLGGGLTWLLARNADHVGASGLVFCYFGFLASRALFDRTLVTFCLSIVCLIVYGGILMGLLPVFSGVSWEGHVAGILAGVVDAWLIASKRVEKRTQKP
jgi:membrane associated rhomboid family serine protease